MAVRKAKRNLTTKAIRLLRRVERHILQDGRRIQMEVWERKFGESEYDDRQAFPACGTKACIAGWVNILGSKRRSPDPQSRAIRLLGFVKNRSFADRLFYAERHDEGDGPYYWPQKFVIAYENARTPQARARVTADRIEHFIKTDGME